MGKENFVSKEIINKDSMPSILREIAQKREQKGTFETLIPYIEHVRQQAEILGDHTTVVQLYQEKFLSAQNMVRQEASNKLHANFFRGVREASIMKKSAEDMKKYEETYHDQIDPVVGVRVFRYLGRYADHIHQYGKSEELYKKGLSYFDSRSKPEEKYNRLEFAGFLSHSQIKQGKQEGLDLAIQTLKDFDQSPEGLWLKENDYYTWAVWKSGIEIRTASHFGKKKDVQYFETITGLIVDAESILQTPDGNQEQFRFRLDKLNKAKELFNL